MGTVFETLAAALGLGLSAAFFDVEAFRAAGSSHEVNRLTLVMLFLAGVSRASGTMVILALNRVPGRRYPLVFATEGLVFVLAALVHAASAVVADRLFFDDRIPDAQLFWIVALAYAPVLFGVFVLMPYLGEAIDRLLKIWAAILVFFALQQGLAMPAYAALAVSLLGWLTYVLLSVTLGRPAAHLVTVARRIAAGRPL